jgi:serine/threonine protein kinase
MSNLRQHYRKVSYLVMELINGGTLRTCLEHAAQHGKPVPLVFALDLLRQAAEGLDEAHRHGLVHRDIKLDNLLLQIARKPDGSEFCTLKVADFGLALSPAKGVTSRLPMFTLDYASPEQLELRTLDGRSDIFSLGVVGYELLAGAKPFGTANDFDDALARRRQGTPRSLRTLRADVPPQVEGIIMRSLSFDLVRRPTAAELVQALNPLIGGTALAQNNLTGNKPLPNGITQLPTMLQTSTPSPWPRVRVHEVNAQPRTMELTQAGLTVGRDGSCDVVLNDPDVSRRHLVISWDGTEASVEDPGSSNGTLLGRKRLLQSTATPWPYNVPVQLGSSSLQLLPPTPVAVSAPASGAATTRYAPQPTSIASTVSASSAGAITQLSPATNQQSLSTGGPSMYCRNCGTGIGQGMLFCSKCGQAVAGGGQAIAAPMQPVQPIQVIQAVPTAQGWGGGLMTFLVIMSILFPIGGLIAGIVGLTKSETRGQGGALIALSVVVWAIAFAIIMSASGY